MTPVHPTLAQAINLLEAHRPAEALSLLEAIHQAGDTGFEVMFHLGVARNRIDARQEAVMAFKCATQLRPDATLAWVGMGVAYGFMNRHGLAIEALQRAVDLGDVSGQAQLNLGRALTIAGRCREGMAMARQARDMLPDNDLAAYAVCLALNACSLDPANADPQASLAEVDAALGAFIVAFAPSPLLEEARDLRDQIAHRRGRRADAALRSDVLAGLHTALQEFDALHAAWGGRAGIAPIVLEIVTLLQSGRLDASAAAARYTLDSLPGRSFDRTQLLAYLYAGAKQLTITVDFGIDFEPEYELAVQQRQQPLRQE
ncbi:MAG TPA: hypothetical protein VE029_14095 [Rhizobacter sp.]|nr:hypothetical protein [Rhizobacter sp.]